MEAREIINCDVFNYPPVAKEALEVWSRAWKDSAEPYDLPYATPDTKKIHEALASIYELVGAKSDDPFFFFSSEEEAMEAVFSHVLFDHMFETGKNHILSLDTEGASTMALLKRFEKAGCSYQLIGSDALTTLQSALSPRVGLVTMSWVHPLTGMVQPLYEIADLCKKHKVLLHVRGTEALGKLFFRYQDIPVDFMTFGGSTFYLPQGAAGLFAKKGSKIGEFLAPVSKVMGQHWIPANVPAILAMGEMAHIVLDQMETGSLEIARLRGEFEDRLQERIPDVLPLNQSFRRVVNVSVMAFPYVTGEALLFELTERGVLASMGGGKMPTLEYVLKQMGQDPLLARSALSFAFSSNISEGDITKVVGLLGMIIEKYEKLAEGLTK